MHRHPWIPYGLGASLLGALALSACAGAEVSRDDADAGRKDPVDEQPAPEPTEPPPGPTEPEPNPEPEPEPDASVEEPDAGSDAGTDTYDGPKLVVSDLPLQSTEAVFELGAATLTSLVQQRTPPCALSTEDLLSHHTYVRIDNPDASPVTVELRVGRAPDAYQVDVTLAAYASLPDASNASRAMCLSGGESNCFTDFDYLACLLAEQAVVVPANGHVWAYIGNNSSLDEDGPFLLRATRLD